MIVYRNPGPWGSGKGSVLASLELDGNFYDHEQRINFLESNPPLPTSIQEIDVTNGQMTITLTDTTVQGPFPLPVAYFTSRGDWSHPNHYNILDIVTVPGQGSFMVEQTHDTVEPFDPNRVIGGQPVYHLMIPPGATGAAGAPGADGAPGPQGPAGDFVIHAVGTFAERTAYDAAAENFMYLSTDGEGNPGEGGMLFQMGAGGVGDWIGPFPFQGEPGPAGADGAPGPAGPPGESFDVDASGPYSGRSAYDSQSPGFAYLSTDGAAGAGPPSVIYMRETATAGVWSAAIPFQGPTGATGPTGPLGPQGLPGANFDPDAIGTFVERAAYNGQTEGFSFLSTDGDGTPTGKPSIFIRETATAGVWGDPIPFQGPQGPIGPQGLPGATGPAGPQGPSGTNFQVNATGTFAERSAYNAQAAGFSYLSTNGDGTGHAVNGAASIYIKASDTAGDWGPRIPFQGPQGATGPAGSAGPAGPAGPAGTNGTNGVGVPAGGTTGQVLAKTSNANFATAWVAPSGGGGGATTRTLKTETGATYTAVAGDETKYLRFTNAAGCTVTINNGVFAAEHELWMRATQGKITLAGSASAFKPSDVLAKSRAAMATIHAYFIDANGYDLTGDLELV